MELQSAIWPLHFGPVVVSELSFKAALNVLQCKRYYNITIIQCGSYQSMEYIGEVISGP